MDPFMLIVGVCLAVLMAYLAGRVDGRAAEVRDTLSRKAPHPAVPAAEAKPWPDPFPDAPLPVAVGERFVYMRVTMICTAHVILSPYGGFMAGVRAEYRRADGCLELRTFSGPELVALQAELGRHFHQPT